MLAPVGESNTITSCTGSGDSHRMPLLLFESCGLGGTSLKAVFSPAITSSKRDEEFQGLITDSFLKLLE